MKNKQRLAEQVIKALLEFSAFALPERVVAPKLGELTHAGFTPRKAELTIDGFVIDARVFRPKRGEKPAHVFREVGRIIGKPDELELYPCAMKKEQIIFCTWRNGSVTIDDKEAALFESESKNAKDRAALAAYTRLLEKFSRLAGGVKVRYLTDGGGIQAPSPDTQGAITVFSQANPPGDITDSRYIAYAFGHKLDGGVGMAHWSVGPTRGRGTVLQDEKGTELVQVLGSNFYFLIPTITIFNPKTSETIFSRMLALAWNEYRKHAKRGLKCGNQRSVGEKRFVRVASEWVGKWPAELRRALVDSEKKILFAQETLVVLLRAKVETEAMVRLFSSTPYVRGILRRLPKDFRKLRALPEVRRVALVDDGIQVETAPVEIEHGGDFYALGSFMIRVNAAGVVTVWNEAPTHPKGIPHPHLTKDSSACFGNATEAILKHASQYRFYDCIMLVLRWLKYGYAPKLALVKIEEWPVTFAVPATGALPPVQEE